MKMRIFILISSWYVNFSLKSNGLLHKLKQEKHDKLNLFTGPSNNIQVYRYTVRHTNH